MSCLRLIGRLVALFIIFIFVTVTPPLILAYNAQQAAVSGDFLDELFEDTDLFEDIIPEIAEDLASEIRDDLETHDMPIARLNADDWERIIYAVAPPQAMQEWSQEALQGFRRWVRRGGRFLDEVIIPFGKVRDNIVNDQKQTVLRTLTQLQPACSGGEEPLDGPNNLIPQCQPPAPHLEAFYQQLAQRWREQPREVWRQLMPDEIARYPDNTSLADFIEEESGEEWWEERDGWHVSRWGLRAAQWLIAVFIAGQCVVALGLVALFAARNWREALRWVGTPLVLAGAFTLLLALLFFVGGEIGTWFIPDEEVPIGAQEVIEDAVGALADELWPPMSWQGGVLVLIGLGMWVLSFFTPLEYEVTPAPAAAGSRPVAVSEAAEAAAPEETPQTEMDVSEPPPPEETRAVEPEESQALATEETLPTKTGESEPPPPEEIPPTETGEEKREPPDDTV
jgi:hypothetical protein